MRRQEKAKSDWPDRVGARADYRNGRQHATGGGKGQPGTGEALLDRRKTRQVGWNEARLALAHQPGSVTPIFGATLGSVQEAGERLAVCALEAGAGSQTKIHEVGDGAVWISEHMEAQFGSQAQYLVDFYHPCDYLAAPRGNRGKRSTGLEGGEAGLAESQSLEGCSGSSAAIFSRQSLFWLF
jgi:hypothetical protein